MHEAGVTVLVVEDEPIIRLTLVEALEDEGYRVLEASNVLEAIGLIGKNDNISAVVTDIDMPGGLSGLDLVKILEPYLHRVALIVTSGGHAPETLDLPSEARFFSKPYHFEDISFALRAGIAAKQKAATGRKRGGSGLISFSAR